MTDIIKYNESRVLIHKNVVLYSDLNQQVVALTGAQVGLLRAMTAYLNDRKTFVSEYETVGYLWPIDDDWDIILAVVADLERKLMGNDNTIFGYNDRYAQLIASGSHASGAQTLQSTPVPAGYVYNIQSIYTLQVTTGGSHQHVVATDGTISAFLGNWSGITAGIPYITDAKVVLKEGDYIRASFGNTVTDEYIALGIWGYKMQVPE